MATSAPMGEIGWKGIDAILPGVDGNEHQISAHCGPGGLVVAFICNHCPYVKGQIARMVRDAMELDAHGIGFVAVNSNDASQYPDDSFKNMKLFAREHRIRFPYLVDADQHVARSYGAVCTPDIFGFNADMKLQYRGRLDASRHADAPDDLRRDLLEAMIEISRSGRGPAEQIPSIGCSIKWKEPA
jgi:peroxiredoxin